jgi:hypothetical protein
LVKTVLTSKYKTLTTKGTVSVICALAIGSLISDVKVFIDNEEAILKANFLLL